MSRAGGVVPVRSSFTIQSSIRRSKFLSGVLTLVLAVMGSIALSSVAYATADNTSVSASCPGSVFVNNTITCTVTVSHTQVGAEDDGTPQGDVTITPNNAGSVSNNGSCTSMTGTCSFDYTPTAAGSHSFSVSFTTGDAAKWNSSSNSSTGATTANLRTTSTSISCTPTTVTVDDSITCTVTVSDTASGTTSPPVGTITTGQSAGTGTATTCSLASGSCTFDYTPTDTTSPRTVSASYTATDNVHADSGPASSESITVTARQSQTVVECSETPLPVNAPTECTVTVSDISGGKTTAPTGDVTFSTSVTVPTDATFSSTTCTLVAVGSPASNQTSQCSVTYTPNSADTTTHTITASYPGDTKFGASSDTFDQDIQLRRVDLKVTCLPLTLFIFQDTTCTVEVSDGTTAGTPITPSGSVDFVNGGKAGIFSAASCTLASGTCSVTYTPAADDAGTSSATTTITATYVPATAPSEHGSSVKIQVLTVFKRTTSTTVACKNSVSAQDTIYVNETGSCTVTVTDVAEAGTTTAPTGTVSFSVTSSTANTPTLSDCTLGSPGFDPLGHAKSECSTSFLRTLLPGMSNFAIDVVNASYHPDTTPAIANIHAASGGGTAQVVSRRTTTTTVSCDTSGNCTATVAEAPVVLGTAVAISGHIEDVVSPNTVRCANLTTNPCSFAVTVTSIAQNVTVQYVPDDNVHVLSVGGYNITSPDAVPTTPSGGKDIWKTQNALATACFAANDASIALAAIGTLVGLLPDPETGAGFLFEIGVTIPAAQLAAFAFSLPSSVLAAFALAACTDTDGDGLFNVVENFATGTDNSNKDSDGDAMTDGSEIDNAVGQFGGGACPSPLNPDTDADGIMDGSELSYPDPTSPCNVDTDGDGIPDGVEAASHADPTLSNGFYVSTPPVATSTLEATATWPGVLSSYPTGNPGQWSSLTFPFTDTRLQSDPQEQDSDSDGIPDGTEFGHSCTLISGTTLGSFVNDDDSDDDGLQDYPDNTADVADASGNDGELGSDTTPGECDPDSDGDGIQDGTEVNQGTDSLDWDSDNDGLSDTEELQTYFTDPNQSDTDGDGADGQIAFRDAAVAPLLSGYAGALNSILCTSDCEEAFSASTQGNFVGNPLDETDPLQKDTDGDGIQDNVEFIPGCNATNTNSGLALVDGYANSFDSDGDGASDGIEGGATPPGASLADFNLATAGDVPAAESNDGELNDDSITNICDPDADGDGLLDGEELGKSGLNYLDWDTDNDGLSDKEELNTYFTDPTLADTDGDTADGVISTRPESFFDVAHPALTGYAGGDTIDCQSDCEEAFSGTLLFNPSFSATPPGLAGFGNPRDQTDPLQIDTDGDGINDNIEFNPGCNDGPGGAGTGAALFDGFANSFDSDADGLRDYEDAVADVFDANSITVDKTPVSRVWSTYPETPAPTPGGTKAASPDGINDGELNDDAVTGICDSDSDGDGVLDGAEHQVGTDPYDWDTDDDGRDDGEYLGEGPIPTDPFDFDTDDDGLGDGVEVFSVNTTNPVNADTDFDGLCDGGATTPASTQFGPAPTGGVDGAGSNSLCYTGVADHPNDGTAAPTGIGEDINGDGVWDATETNPNDFDTDDDAEGDGVEVLGFHDSRQSTIPTVDSKGRPTRVIYPSPGCMDPLNPDTDGDGLSDGFEDFNHDGNFDFIPSDFDLDPQGGLTIGLIMVPDPEETNPCDSDTDHDSNPGSQNTNDKAERDLAINPLDFDSDNDYLDDGVEVAFVCVAPAAVEVDNDGDGQINEDPIDGIDNDGDGKIDEDPEDFTFITVDNLDPKNRDSDSDGFIDGLEDLNLNDMWEPGIGESNPCATLPIPIVGNVAVDVKPVKDTDHDGFSDEDEIAAGTDEYDPSSHPAAFIADLDLDGTEDDRLWLDDPTKDKLAESVAIDINSNVQVDARIQVLQTRDLAHVDLDNDGTSDDCRYTIIYAFANGRVLHPRIELTIYDFNCDLVIDKVDLRSIK